MSFAGRLLLDRPSACTPQCACTNGIRHWGVREYVESRIALQMLDWSSRQTFWRAFKAHPSAGLLIAAAHQMSDLPIWCDAPH